MHPGVSNETFLTLCSLPQMGEVFLVERKPSNVGELEDQGSRFSSRSTGIIAGEVFLTARKSKNKRIVAAKQLCSRGTPIRTRRIFPAAGRQCRLPVLFNSLLRHTPVLCFFLDSRKKRNLDPRLPVPGIAAQQPQTHRQKREWHEHLRDALPIFRFIEEKCGKVHCLAL